MVDSIIETPIVSPTVSEKLISENHPKEEKVRFAKLREAASKAHPRRVLEHFSKKEVFTKAQEKAAAGYLVGRTLVQEHGLAIGSFAVFGTVALLPALIGAPDMITGIVQEGTLGATGVMTGINVGKAVETATGKKNSKIQKAIHGAAGAVALMGMGHGAHELGGNLLRGASVVGDEPLGAAASVGAQALANKVVEKRESRNTKTQIVPEVAS